LLGITSAIRKVEVKGRLTHRVQIGPIADPSELQRLQRRLSESGIEYLALKAKEPVT
jgi:cell division protein FtsN